MNVIKDVTFEGTILNQVKKTIEFIETQVREHTFLGQHAQFVTKRDYPEFVIQESAISLSFEQPDSTTLPSSNCRNTIFNPIDLRLKTFIDFLQYTLHFDMNCNSSQIRAFLMGKIGAHFARILADVGKMWGNFEKEKSLNLLFLEV